MQLVVEGIKIPLPVKPHMNLSDVKKIVDYHPKYKEQTSVKNPMNRMEFAGYVFKHLAKNKVNDGLTPNDWINEFMNEYGDI